MTTANTKTLITVKTDKTLKKAAERLAAEIGIPLGTLINSFLKQFTRDKEVSFTVSRRPSSYLRSVIDQGLGEFRKGKLPKSHSIEELERELLS